MNAASLQAIATSVAQERSVERVLDRIVRELASQPHTALTRIWLLHPTPDCDACVRPEHCRSQGACLRLAASAGTSLAAERNAEFSRIDGRFQSVPLGAGKVGQIGLTGESVLLADAAADRRWIVDQQWLAGESIVSFAGHPLVFRGEIVGVLAVFSRERLEHHDFAWLRAFADHAAVAIANARAFEEIEALRSQLESENSYLREVIDETHAFGEIIGGSPAVVKLLEQIDLVAPTSASVLILGESGTGKELVARAIHQRSRRRDLPLVKVNCAAVPRELFESEFFGHVRGAFTGALKDRVGRFQLAHGGTIFLDEIGEIPLELQGKLLRVLQEGHIERVGEDVTRQVDVRVVAATNRDLAAEVAAGRFRQDLYFRLSVFPIEVLPLRQRVDDIPLLARHFVARLAAQLNRRVVPLAAPQIEQLQGYDWPGNVRELQNVIERALISSRSGPLTFSLTTTKERPRGSTKIPPSRDLPRSDSFAGEILTHDDVRGLEAENIVAALRQTNGTIYGPRGAACLLGMRPTTLASRIKRLGIKKPR